MQNKRIFALCQKALDNLSSLVDLELEGGNPLGSKETKISAKQNIEYQPDFPYLMADPRIIFIKRFLHIILSQDIFLSQKLPRSFAFRLKNINNWLVKTSSATFLTQMAWNCMANCIFCYQKGNPGFMKFKKRISKEEIKTRLKYFDPKHGLGLVGAEICENDEVLNNPYIDDILKEIRKKDPHGIIEITTNGTSLTPKMVKTLAKANPLLVVVSLNSANPEIRKRLMNDRHPEIAIASLPLLKKNKLPYIASIVTWPGLPFSDIEKTIGYAEENDAYAVRLALPGYSKFFSNNKLFDANALWLKAVKHFYPLLKKYSIPVLMVPHMFVQNLMYKRMDLPKWAGVIKNSPAYDLGIKPDDLIIEINNRPIDSMEEAKELLVHNLLNHKVRLKIKRDHSIFEIELKEKKEDCYPYCFPELKRNAPFGFFLTERYIAHDDVKDIGRYISMHNAKSVLVLASIRAKPFVNYILKKYNISDVSGAKIQVMTPKNHFFGGSVNSGDLLTVEDYIRCIKYNLKRTKHDLVILPVSPFSNWGRDLTGQVNLDIEREIGIPVEFIYNSSVELLS